jgi:hypothetical protein
MDSSTGLISGTLGYDAAQTNLGSQDVLVSASNSLDSSTTITIPWKEITARWNGRAKN